MRILRGLGSPALWRFCQGGFAPALRSRGCLRSASALALPSACVFAPFTRATAPARASVRCARCPAVKVTTSSLFFSVFFPRSVGVRPARWYLNRAVRYTPSARSSPLRFSQRWRAFCRVILKPCSPLHPLCLCPLAVRLGQVAGVLQGCGQALQPVPPPSLG